LQGVALVLLIGFVWSLVKGVKAIKRKSFKHGMKLLGLSFATLLLMGVFTGIAANTPEAKQQAAQEAAKVAADQKVQQEKQAAKKVADEAKKKAEDAQKAQEEAFRNSPEGKYQDWVQNQFDPWNGSAIAVVESVKNQMNDPHSFEHVETTYTDKGNMKGIDVYMTYRGTNAFGGVVTNRIHGSYDYRKNRVTYEMMK
jgi:hypothetical protein